MDIIAKILQARLTRLAPLKIIGADSEKQLITFSFSIADPGEQFFGREEIAVRAVGYGDASGTDVMIDGDRGKVVGTFFGATLACGEIHVNVKFTDADQFLAAQSAFNRTYLSYRASRIESMADGAFKIAALEILAFGLASEGYAPKSLYRKYATLFDGPQFRTINVKWPDANGVGGNARLIDSERAAIIELWNDLPYEPEDGADHIRLTGHANLNFARFIGKRVYPLRNGLPVSGSEPIGVIEGILHENARVPDPKHEGKRRIEGHIKMKMAMLDTLPGRAEWAAIKAGEPRGTVLTFKAARLTRYSEGQNYINSIFDWSPAGIGLENGVVMTATEIRAATAPAPEPPAPSKPGFLKRAAALIGGVA